MNTSNSESSISIYQQSLGRNWSRNRIMARPSRLGDAQLATITSGKCSGATKRDMDIYEAAKYQNGQKSCLAMPLRVLREMGHAIIPPTKIYAHSPLVYHLKGEFDLMHMKEFEVRSSLVSFVSA